MGIVVFATMAVIVFNLVVDLLYAVIDPRIRLQAWGNPWFPHVPPLGLSG